MSTKIYPEYLQEIQPKTSTIIHLRNVHNNSHVMQGNIFWGVEGVVWVPLDSHSKNFIMAAVSLLFLRNSMFTFHNYTIQMKQKIACKCLIVHSTILCDSLHLHYLHIVQL